MADAGAGAGAVALSSNAVLTTADIKHLSVAQCDRLLHRIRAGMDSLSNTDELELNLTRAQRVLNAFGETENPEEFAAAATCVSTASRLIRRAKGSFLIQNTTSSLASLTDVGTHAFDHGSSDSTVKPPTPFGAQTFSFGSREASERTPTRFSTPANISGSIPTGTGPFGASTSSTPFTTAAKRLREPSDKSHDGGASSRKGEVSAVAPGGYQRPAT
ncbi:hypothetical protein MBLNU230_g6385t1 [Neophaeotheca triangularis]